jgi:hypothetical protein
MNNYTIERDIEIDDGEFAHAVRAKTVKAKNKVFM